MRTNLSMKSKQVIDNSNFSRSSSKAMRKSTQGYSVFEANEIYIYAFAILLHSHFYLSITVPVFEIQSRLF